HVVPVAVRIDDDPAPVLRAARPTNGDDGLFFFSSRRRHTRFSLLLNPHLKVALVICVDHPEDGVYVAFNRVTACRVTRVVLSGVMKSQQRCLRPRSLPDDDQMTDS